MFYHNQSFKPDNPWLTGFPTRLRALPDSMTRIDILVPSTFAWRPGQHCFLRFPSLSVFDNHPFTIASVPESGRGHQGEKSQEMRTLSFFVRSHEGFTRKLSRYTSNNVDGSMQSWIDGPYGGVGRRIENGYDTTILIAGGSGITSCLPWLQYLSQKIDDCTVRTANVKLLWVKRDPASLGWVSQELAQPSRFATWRWNSSSRVTHQPGEKAVAGNIVKNTLSTARIIGIPKRAAPSPHQPSGDPTSPTLQTPGRNIGKFQPRPRPGKISLSQKKKKLSINQFQSQLTR